MLYALCLQKKYNQYKLCLHKLSNLDGILLLKNIAQISAALYPIIKIYNLIEIRMKYAKKTIGINILILFTLKSIYYYQLLLGLR